MSGNYKIVSWPEIQLFMDHPRWKDCIFCQHISGHPCPDSTYAVPEDISAAISFLISDNASMITGHNLVVDGGWTIY